MKKLRVKQSKSPAEEISGIGGKILHVIGQITIVLWVAFTIALIGWVILASFSKTSDIFKNELFKSGFTLKGYDLVFTKYNMGAYFFNSLFYTVTACGGLIFLCAPAAFVLSKFKFKGKNLFDWMFSTALGLPGVMLLAPLFMMITSLNMNDSMITLIVVYICTGIPFTTVYLTGFFATVPLSVFESGLTDGCTHISSFYRLILPLAQPGIITVTIFNFMGYWNEYIWALTLANKESNRTLAVGLQAISQGMTNTGNYTGLFAGVVVVFVPTFIIYIFMSKKVMSGVTAGAVKG